MTLALMLLVMKNEEFEKSAIGIVVGLLIYALTFDVLFLIALFSL